MSLTFWNLQYLFQIFFVTAEKPKPGLYVTLLAGVSNMIPDALFIAVFRWRLAGAAAATAIGQIIGGGLPLIYFFRRNNSLLRLGKTKFDGKATLKGITNGMGELLSGISGSLVGILYNSQLLSYAGEDGVAAYGIMIYVNMVFTGISMGYVSPLPRFRFDKPFAVFLIKKKCRLAIDLYRIADARAARLCGSRPGRRRFAII